MRSVPAANTESGMRHAPQRGAWEQRDVHATGNGSDTRNCGDFCEYYASKQRQMASNPDVATYSRSACKRLIVSS